MLPLKEVTPLSFLFPWSQFVHDLQIATNGIRLLDQALLRTGARPWWPRYTKSRPLSYL